MTTQATTIRGSRGGVRALLAATAFTAVAVAGTAFWLVRPEAPEAASPATAARAATSAMAGLDGESDVTPTGHPLVVASAADIPDAYARLVERFGALDGSTPLVVTIGVGDCGATVGPAPC